MPRPRDSSPRSRSAAPIPMARTGPRFLPDRDRGSCNSAISFLKTEIKPQLFPELQAPLGRGKVGPRSSSAAKQARPVLLEAAPASTGLFDIRFTGILQSGNNFPKFGVVQFEIPVFLISPRQNPAVKDH